jgi:putative intracellular protease/amidase
LTETRGAPSNPRMLMSPRALAALGRLLRLLALCTAVGLCACSGANVSIGRPTIPDSRARMSFPDKRVLIVVSSHAKLGETSAKTGYWLSEVTHFYHVLARHGFDIDFVSPAGASSVMDPSSDDMGDPLNRTFLEQPSLRARLERPLSPSQINPSEYVVIYYAGGHGTMWDFPDADDISAIATSIYEHGGVVSAVCHGPSGLLNIRLSGGQLLLAGKRVTGFSDMEEVLAGKSSVVPFSLEEELSRRSWDYSSSLFPFASYKVVDGRLVTGQNPGSAAEVGEAVIEVLASRAFGGSRPLR